MQVTINIPNIRIILLALILIGGTCLGIGSYLMFHKVKEVANASPTPTPETNSNVTNTSTVTTQQTKSRNVVAGKRMTVSSTDNNPTGIVLKSDNEVNIQYVSGQWSPDRGANWGTPIKNSNYIPGTIIPTSPAYALVGYTDT